MSYWIEHNRAVVETKDGYYLFFSKGGDNNLINKSKKRKRKTASNKLF